MASILVIEDHDTMREGLYCSITRMGHFVVATKNGAQGIATYKQNVDDFDFVITDLKMDDKDGMTVLRELRHINPDVLIMIITGYGTIETAVDAMKEGAYDFITKPFSYELLKTKIDSALKLHELKKENAKLSNFNSYLRHKEKEEFNFDEIVGTSSILGGVKETIKKVAPTHSTVLISGESGTGKELVARAIHYNSERRNQPFISFSCSALAESLLESELFGHERGAFTGAVKGRLGRFELADRGTIFLDEIGDLSSTVQLKLLRVLQEREFERVGGTRTIKVDVRIICATNKNLQKLIEDGTFREDLYYRIHIIPIVLPSLREHKEDIPALAHHFLNRLNERFKKNITTITPKALQVLSNYKWPGNIRELENIIEQSYVLSNGSVIDEMDLPWSLKDIRNRDLLLVPQSDLSLPDVLDNLEKQLIEKAYVKSRGIKAETARSLGIKTSALYYKLEKYGLLEKYGFRDSEIAE